MLRLDHLVIAVFDLEQAIADYRALGFNAFFGGVHAGGQTHNALIVFQDGTYLELLAPTYPNALQSSETGGFLSFFAQGEGIISFALLSDDLAADVTAMTQRGLPVALQPPNGRQRPDGETLSWQSATLSDSMTPFFIQDITPRVLRVPDDPSLTSQPNGVTGIQALELHSTDLSTLRQRYQQMTGVMPQPHGPSGARLQIGQVNLDLYASHQPLIGRVILTGSRPLSLDVQRAHNAHLMVQQRL